MHISNLVYPDSKHPRVEIDQIHITFWIAITQAVAR